MKVRRLSNNELYHHGIKGQKWGVQNGPPYPLDQNHEIKTLKKATAKEETWLNNYNHNYNKKSKAIKAIQSDKHAKELRDDVSDREFKLQAQLSKDFNKNIKKYESHYHKNITSQLDDDELVDLLKRDKSYLHESMREEMAYNDSYTDYIYRDIIKSNKSKYKPLINNYKLSVNLYQDYLDTCATNVTGKYADTPIKRARTGGDADTYKKLVIECSDEQLGSLLYNAEKGKSKLYWEKGLVD